MAEMGMRKNLENLKQLEAQVRRGGTETAIERQHKAGKLTARERVDLFFDKGSFIELDLFARHECHDFGMDKKRPFGDAVITGYGKVEGRLVYAYAQDFTVLGGTVGIRHAQKVCHIMDMARKSLG